MISWLLYLANARPPSEKKQKERFYAMKQRICERFATPDGFDVQHFTGKKCWSCGGSGIHYYWDERDEDYCWKCNGTGWYRREKWVILKRWKLGKRVFHQPDGVAYGHPFPSLRNITIEGYIEHGYHGFAHEEATMWLALAFDWKLLGMLLAEGTTYVKWPRWYGPMVHLRQIAGKLRFRRQLSRIKASVSEDIPF